MEGESESIRCDVRDSISKREQGLGVADSQFVLPLHDSAVIFEHFVDSEH